MRDATEAKSASPSDIAGLRRLGAHLALLACTGGAIGASFGSIWLAPALILHGVVQVALFAPLHEATHGTAFRTPGLNRLVARVLGFVHFLPATYFRCYHLEHHRFTQDPDRDPELQSPKPATLWAYARHVSGLDSWRTAASGLVRRARGRVEEPWIPPRERAAVVREARWHLVGYVVVAVGSVVASTAPIWFWVLPALLGHPFLRLYLLAEHTGCPEEGDAWSNTRTTLTSPVVRFAMWNMPYHAEHHARPNVPFWALPALHADEGDSLRVTAPGYVAFNRGYFARLRRTSRAGAPSPPVGS